MFFFAECQPWRLPRHRRRHRHHHHHHHPGTPVPQLCPAVGRTRMGLQAAVLGLALLLLLLLLLSAANAQPPVLPGSSVIEQSICQTTYLYPANYLLGAGPLLPASSLNSLPLPRQLRALRAQPVAVRPHLSV